MFGSLLDQRLLDEVYAFVAPKFVGGESAPGPVGGTGLAAMHDALRLHQPEFCMLDGDVLIHGRIDRRPSPQP